MAAGTGVVTRLVGEQRKRLLASILGFAEREFYEDLSFEQQVAFRKKVLDAVGVYSDFVLDVIRAADDGWMVNEEARKTLAAISRQVSELHERSGR